MMMMQMMMQIWLRGGGGEGGEGRKVDGYHADALTYVLIACIGSPSCAFSNSVALTFVNSNSATCFARKNEEPGSWSALAIGVFVLYHYNKKKSNCHRVRSSVFSWENKKGKKKK